MEIDDSAEKALRMMGMTPEEVDEADAELIEKKSHPTNRQICICGHAIARHTVTHGAVYCKPARMECPCKKPHAVLETSDSRLFIRKTDGGGPLHALSRGIRMAMTKGKSVTWLIEMRCDRCGETADRMIPTPVSQRGIATDYATGYDALLCPSCREEV